jgi:hypothetical protein
MIRVIVGLFLFLVLFFFILSGFIMYEESSSDRILQISILVVSIVFLISGITNLRKSVQSFNEAISNKERSGNVCFVCNKQKDVYSFLVHIFKHIKTDIEKGFNYIKFKSTYNEFSSFTVNICPNCLENNKVDSLRMIKIYLFGIGFTYPLFLILYFLLKLTFTSYIFPPIILFLLVVFSQELIFYITLSSYPSSSSKFKQFDKLIIWLLKHKPLKTYQIVKDVVLSQERELQGNVFEYRIMSPESQEFLLNQIYTLNTDKDGNLHFEATTLHGGS